MATNIPISQIVGVDITVETAAIEGQDFNTLLVVGAQNGATLPPISQTERVRRYDDITGVAADWGSSSEVYKACSVYFGQDPKPDAVLVTARFGAGDNPPNAGSKVLGIPVNTDVAKWQAITDGSFAFIYNSIIITLRNLDFSSITTIEEVVDVIQANLNSLSLTNQSVEFAVFDTDGTYTWFEDAAVSDFWVDLNDNYWTTLVAPTGELFLNYDPNTSSFYMGTTDLEKNFLNVQAYGYGTDISNSSYLGLSTGRTVSTTVVASTASIASALAITDVTTLQAVDDGSFGLTIGGTTTQFSDIDFTLINEPQEICALLSAKISTVTGLIINVGLTSTGLVIQSPDEDITVTAVVAGATGTDVSADLFGTLSTSAANTYLETPAEAILAAQAVNNDWYGVALAKKDSSTKISDELILGTAALIQSIGKMYFARLSDLTVASSSTSDIATTLANYNYTRTVPLFSEFDEYIDAGAAGKLLPTTPGSSTLKFKQVSGIAASTLSSNAQSLVLNKNVNLLSVVGGASIIRNGTTSSTTAWFADITRFTDYLINLIEVNVFSLFVATDKVAYTDGGASTIEIKLKESLDQGVEVGGLASFVNPSTNAVVPAYTITVPRVATVPLAQRSNRIAPTITFTATLAGAIHSAQINGTLTV